MATTFTPLFDEITEKYGVVISAVYGYVWRKCQLESGVCSASLQTIADELNISRRTIVSHIKRLVNDGLIEDLTPNANRKSHKYLAKNNHLSREINSLSRANFALDDDQTRANFSTTRANFAPKDNVRIRNNNIMSQKEKTAVAFFEGMTGFTLPHETTMQFNDHWLAPIQAILKQSADFAEAEKRITWAIQEMRQKGYIIKSPKSILTFALNWQATPSPSKNGTHPPANVWDTVLDHARRADPNFTDEAIKTAVRAFGWVKLQNIKPGDENFYRKDFMRIYNAKSNLTPA